MLDHDELVERGFKITSETEKIMYRTLEGRGVSEEEKHIQSVVDFNQSQIDKKALSEANDFWINKEREKTRTANTFEKNLNFVLEEIKQILISKNRKYGNSALEPKRIFSKASNIEQIKVRIDDKLSRMMSGQQDEDEDVELDLLGYLILLRVAKLDNT